MDALCVVELIIVARVLMKSNIRVNSNMELFERRVYWMHQNITFQKYYSFFLPQHFGYLVGKHIVKYVQVWRVFRLIGEFKKKLRSSR